MKPKKWKCIRLHLAEIRQPLDRLIQLSLMLPEQSFQEEQENDLIFLKTIKTKTLQSNCQNSQEDSWVEHLWPKKMSLL